MGPPRVFTIFHNLTRISSILLNLLKLIILRITFKRKSKVTCVLTAFIAGFLPVDDEGRYCLMIKFVFLFLRLFECFSRFSSKIVGYMALGEFPALEPLRGLLFVKISACYYSKRLGMIFSPPEAGGLVLS